MCVVFQYYMKVYPIVCSSLCSAGAAVTTTIALYSDYGNIPSLGMLDGILSTYSIHVLGTLSLMISIHMYS